MHGSEHGHHGGGFVQGDYDSRPRDLSKYRLLKPHFDDRLFFLYDFPEGTLKDDTIEQASISQHQIVFSRSPNFWVDDNKLDSLFNPSHPLDGHKLVEYPGSKGDLFVKSWNGTYTINGELPWRFPSDECHTLYARGRARWFFANVKPDGSQMGGFYPGPWSPWSDVTGLQFDVREDIKCAFTPGTPGILWWKRSVERPDVPPVKTADTWSRMPGWTYQEIKEDFDPSTAPVWRMTRYSWLQNQTKTIRKPDRTVYVPDFSLPKVRKWYCTGLISVDPHVERELKVQEERERLERREREIRRGEEEEKRLRARAKEAARRQKAHEEGLKREREENERREKEYKAKKKRIDDDATSKAMVRALNFKIKPMSRNEQIEFLRMIYQDDKYNAFDSAIEFVAGELGIKLDG